MQIQILFENQHFLAADKPSGWLSVPSRQGSDDQRPCLGKHLEQSLNCRLWPVHRLDFEVSGLILFAKTAPAHKTANRWFENHDVKKTYEAWTPFPDSPSAEGMEELWKSILVRGKKRAFEATHGKPAETIAILTAKSSFMEQPVAIWHLQPLTGRSHQLRYELYKRKIPVIGDTLYGSDFNLPPDQIALRSIVLDFSQCDAAGLDLPSRITAPLFHF